MKFDSFIGGSYQSQAVTADCERTINWYPELLQSSGATSKMVLYPTPGVEELSAVSVGLGRAHFCMNDREFAVIGTTFYEIGTSGALTSRGTVALDSNPATISSNGAGGDQLFVTSGGNGYVYNLTANTLSQIAALDGKATFGDHLDGYFLALDANTATLYISLLLDGATWNTGLDFAQRSLAPDPWRAMRVVGRYIWLFGEQTSEVWYDTGANFPFAPHPSGLVQYGIAAPFSAVILGGDVVWLASTKSGRICVLRASGFTPEVISNYPLETAFGTYQAISSAVGDAYADAGHTFYLLGFDKSDITWAWDAETKVWHERGTWISNEDRYVAWRPRFYARAFGQHRMLDASSGKVYRMGLDLYGDVDGLNIRRLRRAPAIMNENQRVFYAALEVDLEPGLADPVPTTAAFEMHCVLDVVAAADPNPVNIGADVTFTPTVTGCILPYTYQWVFEVDTLWADLVGAWSLDEPSGTRYDCFGTKNLTEVGTVGTASGAHGLAGDFTAGYVTNTVAPLLTQNFTFSMWFKAPAGSASFTQLFHVGGGLLVGLFGHVLWIVNEAWGTTFRIQDIAPTDDGAWHHLVVWMDTGADMFLHASVDGAATLDSSFALVAPFAPLANPMFIGYGLGGTTPTGLYIQRVAWFDAVLTAPQRAALLTGQFYGSGVASPVYAYPTAGAKVASVTVTSANACTDTDTVDVTVNDVVVQGVVADDANPINLFPGALVFMVVDGTPWSGNPAVTDANGIYTFSGMPAGVIVVMCTDSGYSGTNTDTFTGTVSLTLDIVMTGS